MSSRPLLMRFYPYFRPHISDAVLAVCCMGMVSGALGAQVLLIRKIIDGLMAPNPQEWLKFAPAGVILCYGIQALGEVGRGYLLRRAGQRVMLRVRTALFDHLQTLELAFFVQSSSGQLQSRLIHDVQELQKYITVFIILLQKPLSLVVLLLVAHTQAPELTLISLAFLPTLLLPMRWLRRRVRRETQGALQLMGRITTVLQETFLGIKAVRAYGLEPLQHLRFVEAVTSHEQSALRATLMTLLNSASVTLVSALSAALLLWRGSLAVQAGSSTPGTLLSFLVALGLMYDPIKSLAQLPMLLAQAHEGSLRLMQLFDRPPTIKDAADCLELQPGPCSIEIDNLSFGYGGTLVLNDISLKLEPGTRAALVGVSGAGKSTLLQLIPRLAQATSGSLRVAGQPVERWSIQSLRRHVVLVPQEPFLFDDTVMNNLMAGNPAISPETIRLVVGWIELDELVAGLGEGYETRIGDGGCRLSGGQRQRLALARALLRWPSILLLDEATSALDQPSEARILARIYEEMKECTVLLVAHRESSLDWVDRVLTLEGGRVTELPQQKLTQNSEHAMEPYAAVAAQGSD